jgi:hypothetical protein
MFAEKNILKLKKLRIAKVAIHWVFRGFIFGIAFFFCKSAMLTGIYKTLNRTGWHSAE